ncbi:predicted protein [Sclerotinia sclerotiorum 1980 UF-70]|uniref:Uncharacterized protein n=1 Tax=Sclerotinia sclerotiorum (strain ATCC 18683 / 1980 / Ss-1) TaxID=665079 RepID=A7EVT8_SCLS1|nr:predicted protein [Sclerotinia sclerotiorum 1980 UF-70]EDN93580.1 predicted protein [Sclerotinia sclerotiorum 1980 UF-70]
MHIRNKLPRPEKALLSTRFDVNGAIRARIIASVAELRSNAFNQIIKHSTENPQNMLMAVILNNYTTT